MNDFLRHGRRLRDGLIHRCDGLEDAAERIVRFMDRCHAACKLLFAGPSGLGGRFQCEAGDDLCRMSVLRVDRLRTIDGAAEGFVSRVSVMDHVDHRAVHTEWSEDVHGFSGGKSQRIKLRRGHF